MRRTLLKSPSFVRTAKKVLKKSPDSIKSLQQTLEYLQEDIFLPSLRTHKLQGKLEGSYACSLGYDMRLIFEIVQYEGKDAILLQSLGTHEDVY